MKTQDYKNAARELRTFNRWSRRKRNKGAWGSLRMICMITAKSITEFGISLKKLQEVTLKGLY